MRSVALFLLFALFAAVAALADSDSLHGPLDYDPAVMDINCTRLITDVNVTRAIAVAQLRREANAAKSWLADGMGYLDDFHAGVTQTVHIFSANADRQIASFVGDENASQPPRRPATPPRDGNASEGMSDYFNRLFRDDTYLYSAEASYLILRIGLETNKEEGGSFLNEIKFALSLPFTEKTLQIFIGDPLADEDKTVVDDEGRVDQTTTVGARYFVPEFIDDLKTDISVGLRGIADPFVQTRIEYPMNVYDWLIRPVQYVEYSVKREFYEESDLFFDRRVSRSEMVRLLLKRSTETQKVGMQYAASLAYFNTLKYKVGFRTFVSLTGETALNGDRYVPPRYADVDPHTGVYRYSFGGSWKQSFLRNWLFYEIEPRVDYDMLYAWRPNYVVRYWLEFFFGDMQGLK